MIWLIPFLIVFVYIVIFEKKNILNTVYTKLIERWGYKIPLLTQLLSCIFCLSFWISIVCIIILRENWMFIPYITVSSNVLYNLIYEKN